MTKRALPLLTGGLNEVTRSDLIDDSQLQQCLNYEIEGDGTLVLRTDPEQFDSTLDDKLSELFSTVLKISEPWYPQSLQEYSGETRSDYFLFAFGETVDDEGSPTGIYELHSLWDKDGEWINTVENENGITDENTLVTLLSDADIIYTSSSNPEINIASDKVIIVDGINRAHYVTVDTDGNMRAGIMGIPAPTNKPRITEMTTFRDDVWETSSTASYLSVPGLFQCVYTVVTKYGDESNPSPLSDTLDMQFFQLDEDGLDERWLEKVEIKDLSVPDVPDNILKDLKYFKVYMRVIRHAAGEGTATLEFTERFEINSKKDDKGTITSGVTGNNYTLTVQSTSGDIASWENDVAPIAKTGAELSGITMLGNVRTKIHFPWNFKYYIPITINNGDSKSYVDAVIKIRLWDKDATGDDTSAIEHFIVTDFIVFKIIKNPQHIRIFDKDLTTPLMICYNGYFDNNDVNTTGVNDYIDMFIKIPLLAAASSQVVYLCWTPEADRENYDGVPDVYNELIPYDDDVSWASNIGIHYGRIFVTVYDGWERQQVWKGGRLKSNSPVMSDFDFREGVGLINRYDANDEVTGGNSINSIARMPLTSQLLSGNSLELTVGTDVVFAPPSFVDTEFPTKGIVSFQINTEDVSFGLGTSQIIKIDSLIFDIFLGIDGTVVWSITENNAQAKSLPYLTDGIDSYFCAFSWDRDSEKRSIFIYSIGSVSYHSYNDWSSAEKLEVTAETEDVVFANLDVMLVDAKYDNIDYTFGRYFSADVADDDAAVQNMANFMPAFDEMIGYNYDTTNNKILFGDVEEIEFKEYKGMVKWTDVNFTSFPDLFYKNVREPVSKIMPAPSFLQFEYQNTFIIFTRNSINRFILKGSADGWSGSSSSIIEEKTQYGLLAPESLVKSGEALFWLSEVGVMMWNTDGLNMISNNIVDIPITSDVIGFYNNLNNQYILHRNLIGQEGNGTNQSITYVFQIERNAWSKYSGFDIVSVAGLTAGVRLENVSLFLDSNGSIKKYPTETYTSQDALIESKELFFEKGTLRRVKAGFEGDSVDFVSYLKKSNGQGEEVIKTNTISSIEPNKWRGIANENSRGKSVSFEIQNAKKIKSIMYDLNIEAEVVV